MVLDEFQDELQWRRCNLAVATSHHPENGDAWPRLVVAALVNAGCACGCFAVAQWLGKTAAASAAGTRGAGGSITGQVQATKACKITSACSTSCL